jgi:hypothetical protein
VVGLVADPFDFDEPQAAAVINTAAAMATSFAFLFSNA